MKEKTSDEDLGVLGFVIYLAVSFFAFAAIYLFLPGIIFANLFLLLGIIFSIEGWGIWAIGFLFGCIVGIAVFRLDLEERIIGFFLPILIRFFSKSERPNQPSDPFGFEPELRPEPEEPSYKRISRNKKKQWRNFLRQAQKERARRNKEERIVKHFPAYLSLIERRKA